MFQLIRTLILLLIVVLVIRRIAKIGLSLWAGFAAAKTRPSASSEQADIGSQPNAMSLVQDPVCGTYVGIDASLKRIVNGKVIHFCSPECRDQYAA
jgi:YHS domain-containing protein